MHVEYVGQEGRILILLELHQSMMVWKESVPGKVDGSWQSLSSVGLHPGHLKDTWGFARDPHHHLYPAKATQKLRRSLPGSALSS